MEMEGCMKERRRHRARRHGRGQGWRRGRFFGPGEVRLALLALLEDRPRHGYDLMGQLEERSGGAYRASAGTIYPTLQQLEDEGLARSESSDGRRVYRLTDAGQSELEAERETVESIWRRAERWGDWGFVGDPDAAEVARPALRLARTAYRVVSRAHGDPDVIDRVREVLERAREEIRSLHGRRDRDRD
jgi:DNA-binding PadR family transcriptional regulator